MYFSFQKQNRTFTIFPAAKYLSIEPHIHSHLEIVYMREGGNSEAFADNTSAIIEEGDLFIVFPNQVHYYNDIQKPINAMILIISPDVCPEFKSFFENFLPETPIFKNANQNPIIYNSLNTLLTYADKNNEFTETVVRGSMLVIMSEYLRLAKLKKISTNNTDTAKSIISFCYENYTSNISLGSIAEALHINRYYVSHLFAKKLNINFNDYINFLRIRKACELLKSDKYSITDTAHAVGYNSIRTFNRCFAKIKGTTPREYRANKLSQKNKAANS